MKRYQQILCGVLSVAFIVYGGMQYAHEQAWLWMPVFFLLGIVGAFAAFEKINKVVLLPMMVGLMAGAILSAPQTKGAEVGSHSLAEMSDPIALGIGLLFMYLSGRII